MYFISIIMIVLICSFITWTVHKQALKARDASVIALLRIESVLDNDSSCEVCW